MAEPLMPTIPDLAYLRRTEQDLIARVYDGDVARDELAAVRLLIEQVTQARNAADRIVNMLRPQDSGRADERRPAPLGAASDGSEVQSPSSAPSRGDGPRDVCHAVGSELELDRTRHVLRYIYQRAQHEQNEAVKDALHDLAVDIEVYCETPSNLPAPALVPEDKPRSERDGSPVADAVLPGAGSGEETAGMHQQPTPPRCGALRRLDIRCAFPRGHDGDHRFEALGLASTTNDPEEP